MWTGLVEIFKWFGQALFAYLTYETVKGQEVREENENLEAQKKRSDSVDVMSDQQVFDFLKTKKSRKVDTSV